MKQEENWMKMTEEEIFAALDECTNPLTEQHAGVYIIYNGLVASDTKNVQDAFDIEREQSKQLSASLSGNFHKPIEKWVKTMEVLKKSNTVEGKAIYDLETQFRYLLVAGQKHNIKVANTLQY